MLAAESAVLVELKSVGIILFVLCCVVVPLFALRARECDLDSHRLSAPPDLKLFTAHVFYMLAASCTSLARCAPTDVAHPSIMHTTSLKNKNKHAKKEPSAEVKLLYHPGELLVNILFLENCIFY